MHRVAILPLLVFLIFHEVGQGQEVLDFTIHQEYTSTRALGMGNAFTAIADDHSSLFYNPATLALRKDGNLRLFLRAGIDDQYLQLLDGIDDTDGADDEVKAISDFIEENYGEHYYSRVPTLGAVWVRPGWGIAFLPLDLSIDVGIHQQVGPQLNVTAYGDSTFAFGYAKDFNWFGKDNPIAIGATLKALHRVHASQSLIAAELATDATIFEPKDANEGLTVDVDIGTLYHPVIGKNAAFSFLRYAKPSFAFVIRNALDYGFPMNFGLLDEESGEPPKLQRRFDLGSKWDLPNFWVFDPHMAVDIRDMGHENWTFKKGSHVGAELYWKMFNWWKGYWSVGLNQGYWTAGFGARMAWFQLDIASFGEEVGTSGVPKESRRYMLEMSLDF